MACKCSPSLKRLMADFAARGHVNSGCCGDAAHAARKSDHNADASGYAHAQDIHEVTDHDLQPYVRFIMANPAKFKHVKYLIYEGHIYYPNPGARAAGKYVYTGPNSHAHHLHVSIHSDATHYDGSWFVAEAYRPQPAPAPQEVPVQPKVFFNKGDQQNYLCGADLGVVWLSGGPEEVDGLKEEYGFAVLSKDTFERIKAKLDA